MNKLSLALVLALTACGANTATAPAPAPAAAPATATTLSPDTVVASWDGGQVTHGELMEQVGMRLTSMEVEYLMKKYDTQSQALDGIVRDRILEAEAASRDITVEEMLALEVEAKTPPATTEQVEAFYAQNAQRMGGAAIEEARPFIEQQLVQQNQGERFRVWYTELSGIKSVDISLTAPDLPRIDVPIAAHDPIFGDPEAPITIIQFAEFECYYCQTALPTVDRILADYDGKVKLVFKDYPLGFHARARPAAIAAHCAGEQDKYSEMFHLLLNNQQQLQDADFRTHATSLDMDMGAFETCLASGKFDAEIDEDMALAESMGVQATPTFFVDGVMVAGALPYEKFAEIIDRSLADGS
ncbi:MAG: protein-disulfide isomerase [Myxococcota bacterium]|jgi:protein-disulfide isomerase